MAPRKATGRGKRRISAASLTINDDEFDDTDLSKPQISLDLASSEESIDDSSEDDDDEQNENHNKMSEQNDEVEEEDSDSEEDDPDEDSDEDDVDPETMWGRSSSQYYAGDTADLEIGQDFEEAKEEEAIAAKLQKKKRMAEDESDYLILDENQEDNDLDEQDEERPGGVRLRDVSRLGEAEQLKVILAESPELRGLLDQMKAYLDELSLLGMALDEAHMGQAEIVTENGLAYLELRNHLLLSFVMNVNFYLLLKAENKPVRDHPVVAKLMKLQRAIAKLKPLAQQAESAVGYLVQKAAEEVLEGTEEKSGSEEEEDEEEEEEEEEEDDDDDDDGNEEEEEEEGVSTVVVEDEVEEERLKDLERRKKKRSKKEKQFELKTKALLANESKKQKKKQSGQKRQLRALLGNDMGDIEQDVSDEGVSSNARKLQSNMNTMVQKQKKKVKGNNGDEDLPLSSNELMKGAKKSLVGANEVNFDDPNFEDSIMNNNNDNDDDDEYFKPLKQKKSEEGNQFYNEIKAASKSRAKLRNEKYGATARVAGAHLKELEEDSKRALSYQIMKNRGLVAHKSKINRNPRVKKREQFRKATIARKGQVRDIRDSAEGAHYQGEATGIRTNISRSRAITN